MSRADENGISFWIPGLYGSLAATPQQARLSPATVFYHTDVSGSGTVAVSREIAIGQCDPPLNESSHRPNGWNAWLTFVLSPAPPSTTPSSPLINKALPRS